MNAPFLPLSFLHSAKVGLIRRCFLLRTALSLVDDTLASRCGLAAQDHRLTRYSYSVFIELNFSSFTKSAKRLRERSGAFLILSSRSHRSSKKAFSAEGKAMLAPDENAVSPAAKIREKSKPLRFAVLLRPMSVIETSGRACKRS